MRSDTQLTSAWLCSDTNNVQGLCLYPLDLLTMGYRPSGSSQLVRRRTAFCAGCGYSPIIGTTGRGNGNGSLRFWPAGPLNQHSYSSQVSNLCDLPLAQKAGGFFLCAWTAGGTGMPTAQPQPDHVPQSGMRRHSWTGERAVNEDEIDWRSGIAAFAETPA